MSRKYDSEKFKNLAELRVSKAQNYIRLIGNLSNKSNYDYTDEEVQQIYRALKKSLEEMKVRFDAKGGSGDDGFKFK